MMTIGEFAARTGLSVSALRFYAGRGLLLPAEVDDTTGYRRYAEAQVSDGTMIGDLRRLDMPLAEVAQALSCSPRQRRALIGEHLRRLERVVDRAHTFAQALGVDIQTTTTEEHAMTNNPTTATTQSKASAATLHATEFGQALDQVLPAAGTDPTMPHLMGVLIEGKDGSVRLVATDSHRLAIRDLVPSTIDGEFVAVVAAATLATWRDQLRGLAEPHELALRIDERTIAARGAEVELTARLIPTTFPDYERFLEPAQAATSVQVDQAQLLTALQAFDDRGAILMSSRADRLTLVRREQEVHIEATCDGSRKHAGINPAFAADAVRHAVGTEVVVEIEQPLEPVLFRSADDGTYTSLVMPVKLD